MYDLQEAKSLLKGLGFSETECVVYFDLLEKPSGEAIDTILAKPHVPRSEAETAVKSLVEKGLAKITSNRLEASDPRKSVGKLQEMKREELSRGFEQVNNSASRLLSLLEPQYWEMRLGVRPEDLLEPLPSVDDMEVRTVRVVSNSSRLVSISAESFGWFTKIREEAYRAIERGVSFRVLMTVRNSETRQRLIEVKTLGMEVRQPREEWYPVRGTLGDDREVIFLIWTARDKDAHRAKYFRPHYSRNAGMIRVFADAFEKRWKEALPL